jgi:hypothetical protein
MSAPNDTPDPLDRLAGRTSSDPFFLGSLLAKYQQAHGLDEAGLAAVLGCPVAVLASLRLCRRPGVAEPERTAEEDIDGIAKRFNLDTPALRRVIADTP